MPEPHKIVTLISNHCLRLAVKLTSQLAPEALSALSMTWPDLMVGAFILKTNLLFSSSQLIENEAMTLDKANTE